mmetsp:Transcript_108233/g.231082  ORF Transcript_108233/g.231082 Transcript_108233/m.231082 type:complete len:500 (+) Transcript_108233:594-2093(+)
MQVQVALIEDGAGGATTADPSCRLLRLIRLGEANRHELPPRVHEGDLGGLLHDAAKLTGHVQCGRGLSTICPTGQRCSLHVEHRAAHRSPRKAGNRANRQLAFVEAIGGEDLFPHVVAQVLLRDTQSRDLAIRRGLRCGGDCSISLRNPALCSATLHSLAPHSVALDSAAVRSAVICRCRGLAQLHDLRCQLSANLFDMLLQVPHPCLTTVPADKRLHCAGLKRGRWCQGRERHRRRGNLGAESFLGLRRLLQGALASQRIQSLHRIRSRCCLGGFSTLCCSLCRIRDGRLRDSLRDSRPEPHLPHGVGHQVILSNAELLLEVVAREADDLHAVEQGPWDRVRDISSAHKKNTAAVHRYVEIVIQEGAVLRGVQEFQQRRCRVALMSTTDLVDLIDEHQGVVRLNLLEALDDFPWHRSDVGPPVALDLCHIVETSDAKAVELAAQGLCNGSADRRLANAGRANEAENLALHGPTQDANRYELQDPLLHIVEPVMVPIEY